MYKCVSEHTHIHIPYTQTKEHAINAYFFLLSTEQEITKMFPDTAISQQLRPVSAELKPFLFYDTDELEHVVKSKDMGSAWTREQRALKGRVFWPAVLFASLGWKGCGCTESRFGRALLQSNPPNM